MMRNLIKKIKEFFKEGKTNRQRYFYDAEFDCWFYDDDHFYQSVKDSKIDGIIFKIKRHEFLKNNLSE